MTVDTGAGHDVGMRKAGWRPCAGAMTRVTRRYRDNMLGGLARRRCTVMAIGTCTRRHTLVTKERRCPGNRPMAIRARRRRRYMLHRHVRTREHAARHVAHGAFPGRAV